MDQHVRRRDGNPRTWLRTIIGLVAAAAILCGLAGCGVLASGGSTENAAERVVKDIDDAEVRVPDNPSRVVALSEPTLDAALALGVTPVGTVSGRGQNSVPGYLADKAKDIPLVGGIGDLDYEKISSLEPDLIIVDGTSVNNRPDVLEILRQIAPLVFCGYAGGPWELNFDTTARALNLEAKGEEVKSAFRDKVSKGRAQLAPTYGDKTFSIVRWQGSGPSLILKELPAGQVLEGLGLKRPQSQDREGRGHSDPVSLENLSTIDADYMFFGTLGGASQANPHSDSTSDREGAAQALETAEETSGFTDLSAYKNHHIITVDGSRWTSTGGPLLLNGIVDDILAELA